MSHDYGHVGRTDCYCPGCLQIRALQVEVNALRSEAVHVNRHRRAVVRARMRIVLLEQAIKWLRSRVSFLEGSARPQATALYRDALTEALAKVDSLTERVGQAEAVNRVAARSMRVGDRVRWFGKPWGAPVCDDPLDRVGIPVGEACGRCGKPFDSDSQGVSMAAVGFESSVMHVHIDCMVASVTGRRRGG